MTVSVILLAAGAGTRMRSDRPKPLHRICGRPMVLHVIHALSTLEPDRTVVVVGHAGKIVSKAVQELAPAWANIAFADQSEQRGTGDAAAIGLASLDDDYDDNAVVVVVPGDTPLLSAESLDELVAAHVANSDAATLLTSKLDDPTGYGRVIRAADGRVMQIVEQRDCNPEQLTVREICTSIYAFSRELLSPALRKLTTNNSQGEFYLTDVIGDLAAMGHKVGCVDAPASQTQGVNDRWQLALAEREFRNRTNRRFMLNGVTMIDPRQTFIDVTVRLGRDITLYPGTILRGDTVVADGTDLGPDTQLDDCVVGSDCIVRHTIGIDASIGDRCDVGPYAFLPPGSVLVSDAVTGAFYNGTRSD